MKLTNEVLIGVGLIAAGVLLYKHHKSKDNGDYAEYVSGRVKSAPADGTPCEMRSSTGVKQGVFKGGRCYSLREQSSRLLPSMKPSLQALPQLPSWGARRGSVRGL